jgi:hypothetical protein
MRPVHRADTSVAQPAKVTGEVKACMRLSWFAVRGGFIGDDERTAFMAGPYCLRSLGL